MASCSSPIAAANRAQGSFSGTWYRRYRRTEMELGRRVSFPRGFDVAARHEPRCE